MDNRLENGDKTVGSSGFRHEDNMAVLVGAGGTIAGDSGYASCFEDDHGMSQGKRKDYSGG